MGEHTPFRQIRRLPQLSLLEAGPDGPRVEREPWPWAEIEPTEDLDARRRRHGCAAHAALLPLRESGAAVLLSGGLDSRAMLGLAHDAGVRRPRSHGGRRRRHRMGGRPGPRRHGRVGGRVQERFGPGDGAGWRRLWQDHLEALDFQFLLGSFVMPMGPAARGAGRSCD